MSKHESEVLDLEDRDPNKLNQHIQVSWNDVFGEPNSIRSPECAWSFSRQCFRYSLKGCYIFLSVLCAPIAACLLGVTFACLSFKQIWCIIPCLRIWKISCGATRIFVRSCTQACIIPCSEGFGHYWSQIKIRHLTLPEGLNKKEEDILIV